jgi:alkylation response protein AidB-like acyl-CoA dehydrogenase
MTSVRGDVATGSDLRERARALIPLLDEHAPTGDARGRLTDEVVEALHRDGFWGLWVPSPIGGWELDPISSLEVIESLAYGDPSVAWVLMAAALAIGTGGAYLGDEAAEELFSGERLPVIVGQGTRPGSAVAQDGGYLLSGSWSFASGIRHATHIHTLAIVEQTGEPRIFVLPVEQATLIDNWDVLGLRATGSIDYTIDGVFVREPFSHFATSEEPKRGGVLYHMGIPGFAAICHTGWALGVGRRLLDELATLSRQKAGRPGAQADNPSFLEGLERAEGKYRAARALAFETWRDAWATLESGARLSVRQQTLIRLAITHVTWAVQEVGSFVYLAGGTTALRSGPIQRIFRDLHAGTQHMIVSPPVRQTIGRELAGLAEGKVWRFLDLVDPAV